MKKITRRFRPNVETLELREVMTATPTFSAGTLWHDNFSFNEEIPLAGDFNGDGKSDIATFTRGGTADVFVALSTGSGFTGTGVKWHNFFCAGTDVPLVGDFNGDGKDDIAAFSRGSTGDIFVAISSGSGFVGTGVKWHDFFCFGSSVPLVGDFNGDGKDDVASCSRGTAGDVFVALSTGSKFNGVAVKWHDFFCINSEIPLVGDFNGDKKADLATFTRGTTGDVYVTLSDGTKFNGTGVKWHNTFCFGTEIPQVGDFNGDKKSDIATFTRGTSGDVFVALSDGTKFKGTNSKWHDSFCFGSDVPVVADPTGFGRDDLISFSRGSTGDVRVAKAMLQTGTNFAVLFSGGIKAEKNHARYYNNIKDLYLTMISSLNVRPENVTIVYADGTSSAIDRSDNLNSDMGYAVGATVLSATKTNLLNTLTNLKNKLDATDNLFFYSFDHGGGSSNNMTSGEEVLNGWGSDIRDDEIAPALAAINAGKKTTVMAQCFSGGIIDDITTNSNSYACAATNHYEFSWGDGFAAAFVAALKHGWRYTTTVFDQAKKNDPYAVQTGYVNNQGTVEDKKEHPWAKGGHYPIFIPFFGNLINEVNLRFTTVIPKLNLPDIDLFNETPSRPSFGDPLDSARGSRDLRGAHDEVFSAKPDGTDAPNRLPSQTPTSRERTAPGDGWRSFSRGTGRVQATNAVFAGVDDDGFGLANRLN